MDLDGEEAESDSEAMDGGEEVSMSTRAPAEVSASEAEASEAAAWPSARRMARVWADREMGMGSLGSCGCCDDDGVLLGDSEVGDVDEADVDEADVEDDVAANSESLHSRTKLMILACQACLLRQRCGVWPCRTYSSQPDLNVVPTPSGKYLETSSSKSLMGRRAPKVTVAPQPRTAHL